MPDATQYVVHVDRQTRTATIHYASCPTYSEGRGEWFGPYEVLEEARGRVEYESRQRGGVQHSSGPPLSCCQGA